MINTLAYIDSYFPVGLCAWKARASDFSFIFSSHCIALKLFCYLVLLVSLYEFLAVFSNWTS